jgi:hypothetical protein
MKTSYFKNKPILNIHHFPEASSLPFQIIFSTIIICSKRTKENCKFYTNNKKGFGDLPHFFKRGYHNAVLAINLFCIRSAALRARIAIFFYRVI